MSDENARPAPTVLIFGGSGAELLDESRGGLPVSVVRQNLAGFMEAVQEILPSLVTAGDYALKEVTVAVGINGKGKVGFLGTGTEVGGSASLTLRFLRP